MRLFEAEKQNKAENKGMSMENLMISKNDKLEKELKRIKRVKDELASEVTKLENEGSRYLETLVKYAKGDKKVLNNFGSFFQPPAPAHEPKTHSPNTGLAHTHNSNDRSKNNTRDSIQYNYVSNGRNLTLKQLKDTIEEIYESKLKYDQKNFDGKLARETMHQYLFTHLNQKYGLKVPQPRYRT